MDRTWPVARRVGAGRKALLPVSFSQFAPATVTSDRDGAPRAPSMTGAGIRDDLVASSRRRGALLDGSLSYEQSLRDYFRALGAALGGDAGATWPIDGVHLAYVDAGALRAPW
jgi:hypothetical protein